jgi:hypothetical protein
VVACNEIQPSAKILNYLRYIIDNFPASPTAAASHPLMSRWSAPWSKSTTPGEPPSSLDAVENARPALDLLRQRNLLPLPSRKVQFVIKH